MTGLGDQTGLDRKVKGLVRVVSLIVSIKAFVDDERVMFRSRRLPSHAGPSRKESRSNRLRNKHPALADEGLAKSAPVQLYADDIANVKALASNLCAVIVSSVSTRASRRTFDVSERQRGRRCTKRANGPRRCV